LTDLVWNDEILEIVRSKPSLREAARALIELANSRGGHDNITVILISVPADFKLVVGKKVNWLPWILAGVVSVILVLALAAALTLSLLRSRVDPTPTLTPTATITPTATPTPTLTPLPTITGLPTLSLPIAPTYTPWPTNTAKP
jgi:hypothetical protein